VTPVPKSTKPARVATNLAVPAFTLTPEQMAAIAALGAKDFSVCPRPEDIL